MFPALMALVLIREILLTLFGGRLFRRGGLLAFWMEEGVKRE